MFKIIGRTIQLTRGDTGFFELTLMNGAEPYIPGEGDTVTFTVKDSTTSAEAKIEKVLTAADYADGNRLVVKIDAGDTAGLRYKDYVYDVQISLNGGEIVNTIIPPSIFRILEEVTF
jgi:hypothetical protein